MRSVLLAASLAILCASPALAQTQPAPEPMPEDFAPVPTPPKDTVQAAPGVHMQTPMKATSAAAADSASTQAYRQAMRKMEGATDVTYTGDADKDFVAGMIPHHQGAIDIAQVELKYGHDKRLKKLARDIISAQKKEIAFMQRWQAKHGAQNGQ